MLAYVFFLLPLQAPAPVDLPAGAPIQLDGVVEASEWQGALELTGKLSKGKTLRARLKRTGPWLAVGLSSDRSYRGELMRICFGGKDGSWVVSMFAGIGQPSLPPALWRRGPAQSMLDSRVQPECPRAVRLRARLRETDSWSAEYLIRLSSFGVGRGDERPFRFFFVVTAPPVRGLTRHIEIPGNVRDHSDVMRFAMIHPVGGWGPGEKWAPTSQEVSTEFNDHELLHRLGMEHEKVTQRLEATEIVIANAVAPRSVTKINALRAQLEAGRRRNPTLPAWDYFLGRLLHEGNFRAEARKLIKSLPPSLARLAPFVNLSAEHHIDTHEPDVALKLLEGRTDIARLEELIATAKLVKAGLEEEQKFIERDKKSAEKNPRVRFVVRDKGEFVCELFEDDAPCAVRNFMDLILRRKFYDQLTFHTVFGGVAAETGNPNSRVGAPADQAHPGFRLKGDRPKRHLLRGYMATVPAEKGLFHGSKVLFAVSPIMRGTKTVFGRIVEGLEVVDSIEQHDRIERVEVISKRNHVYDPLECRVR